MDIFTLTGKIVLDTTEFNNKINAASAAATSLYNTLNQINGINLPNNASTNTNGVAQTGNAVAQAGTQIQTGATNAKNGWTIFKQIAADLGTMAVTKGFNFGKSFLQTGYEYNTFMETQVAHFKTLLQTTEEDAKAFFAEIEQFALETPLTLEGTVEMVTKLLGAGVERPAILDTLQMLGDLALGDTNTMARLAKMLTDVQGNTQLLAQEGRQGTEAGIPIWSLLEQYYAATNGTYSGWDAGQLKSMNKKEYPIPYEDFYGALLMATSDGGMFYGAMETAMNTTEGQAERMIDNYRRAAGAMTKSIVDIFASDTIPALNEILTKLQTWAEENPDALKNLAQGFSDLATNGINLFVGALTGLIDFWNNNRTQFDALLAFLGGFALTTGHFKAGAALFAAAGIDLYADSEDEIANAREQAANEAENRGESPEYVEAIRTGDTSNLSGGERAKADATNIGIGATGFLHNLFPSLVVHREMSEYDFFSESARKYGHDIWNVMNTSGWQENEDLSGRYEMLKTSLYREIHRTLTAQGEEDPNTTTGNWLDDFIYSLESYKKNDEGKMYVEDWFDRPRNNNLGGSLDLLPSGESGSLLQNMTALIQSLSTLKADVAAAATEGVAAGMSGITITGHVTTGDVRLNTGPLVGALTPRINLQLGWLNKIDGRGDA